MDEITQQQLVHDKYCKELMGFGTKPRHITPFTSFQSVQPPQSNALLGLLGYSSQQCFLSFGAVPAPSKSTLVESRYCRELMEERFDQVKWCKVYTELTLCQVAITLSTVLQTFLYFLLNTSSLWYIKILNCSHRTIHIKILFLLQVFCTWSLKTNHLLTRFLFSFFSFLRCAVGC